MSFGAARVAPEKAVFRPALPMSIPAGLIGQQMASTYWEKLKDPRWQKKRLEALEHWHWSCNLCGDGEETLHVHHKQYFKGREPWEYEVRQLSVLCESCHSSAHESEDPLLVAASYVPMDGPGCRSAVAALIAGFSGHSINADHVEDPDNFLLGQFARAIPDSWNFRLGGLGPIEMEALIAAVVNDQVGFTSALRAFAGLPTPTWKGMDAE